ncbi:uncharacterized membrane protein HdeD (DUF308 family) [Altererythrobacter atlanticus]|uniref:Uncharacterized protein n=1 Tax=Croceibacterium atlanticum TaxID=1267766 RepID=A0A0F7KTH8_9SPHN|nr:MULTISPECIES: DUF308 domain-containing protein [Sphingomonadales]AKH43718.1 hypothetical protein WYH_02688 [Croceibacterium atlanticum]MBB5734259.1 uncharacterized membrane protein HdeD (DUF308 family) [Croceibacterium atlanticum]
MASSIDSEVRNMSGFSIGQIECTLSGNWWVFFIRGVLFVLLGALALAMPISAVIALTLLFGAFSFVDGVLALWSGVRRMRKNKRWGWLIASGLIGIVTGAIVLIAPYVASLALALFLWGMIAFWSIMRGGMEIAAAIRMRKEIKGEWLLVAAGLISLLFGILAIYLIIALPGSAVLAAGWVFGIYALIFGGLMLLLGFRLRRIAKAGGAVET